MNSSTGRGEDGPGAHGDMAVTGIPTSYKGYRFRSRLEAKWAKFFDLLGWQWEYEPFDCNGWIPDFALLGNKTHRRKQPVLVEVKPIISDSPGVREKIDRANNLHEVLLVGVSPIWKSSEFDTVQLGWLRDFCNDPKQSWWSDCLMGWWKDSGVGFTHYEGSWCDRISEQYQSKDWIPHTLVVEFVTTATFERKLRELWAMAQNETQWKKR